MRENEALIRKLQVSLLEMLKDIDDLCRKHTIFMLAASEQ